MPEPQIPISQIGHGAVVQRGDDGSPEDWSDLGQLLDPGSVTQSREAVDATHSLSPDRFKQFISGLRDGGEFTFQLALAPATAAYNAVQTDYLSDDSVHYRFVYPSGVEAIEVWGLVTNLEHAHPIGEKMTLGVTIKVSGKPVKTTVH